MEFKDAQKPVRLAHTFLSDRSRGPTPQWAVLLHVRGLSLFIRPSFMCCSTAPPHLDAPELQKATIPQRQFPAVINAFLLTSNILLRHFVQNWLGISLYVECCQNLYRLRDS